MATKAGTTRIAALVMVALVGCSDASGAAAGAPSPSSSATPVASETASPSSTAANAAPSPVRSVATAPDVTTPPATMPRPASRAFLSIPSIGLRRLPVLPYTGEADDRPGTRIQDRGVAASPRGARGGVGPGEVGNFIITAHRTSAGGPLRQLPSLPEGARILVAVDQTIYDYVVTDTMTISFRSARDRARQSASVPGQPGERATRPVITLSTCATPEDHARGNYWTDEMGNPEHRINKVGVLIGVRTT